MRHKRFQSSFDKFYDSLRMAGFESYDAYLASEQWQVFNQWYRSIAALPQACLVCGSAQFILHHWNYSRCGMEWPCDVVPLCESHHAELHRWLANGNEGKLSDVIGCLIHCFNFDGREAWRRYKPIEEFRRCMTHAGSMPSQSYRGSSGDSSSKPGKLRERMVACDGEIITAKEAIAQHQKRVCPGCGKQRKAKSFDAAGFCSCCRLRVAHEAKIKAARNVTAGRKTVRIRDAICPQVQVCGAINASEMTPTKN